MKAIIITPCLNHSIKDVVNIEKDDFVICADNSFSKASSENIRIDLIIGDFDTGKPVSFPSGIETLTFPIEKDDTDTMLAVKEAARRGFTKINIIGGLSGRLDHTFANLQTLAYGAENDIDILITDGENTAFIMRPGEISLEKKEGFSLSVFSYGDRISKLCMSGVKYPVSNATLTSLFPLGVSNDIMGDHANISFSEGMLLIIISKLN